MLLSHTEWIIHIEFVSLFFQKNCSRQKKKLFAAQKWRAASGLQLCPPEAPSDEHKSGTWIKFLKRLREYLSRLTVSSASRLFLAFYGAHRYFV